MPSSDSELDKLESWLLDQVTKSEFFHQKLHEYGLVEIAYAVESVRGESLDWELEELGISEKAWNRVIHRGLKPVRMFAHPYVLQTIERSVGYYRGLALVSRKSMSNIKLSIERFETGTNRKPLDEKKAQAVARRLNELISRLIEVDDQLDAREFDLWRGMTVGAAVKSLSRAKNENANATTMLVMYRVAITDQAQQDLGSHRDAIDYWFTIEDVLNRDETRQEIFRLLGI